MAVEVYADDPTVTAGNWSTLASGYTSGATSLTITSNTKYGAADPTASPPTKFRVRIDNEIFVVTDNRTTTWTVAGAQEGSSAANHSSGATVTEILTKGSYQELQTPAVTVVGTAGSSQTVTFPAGPFAAAYRITASAATCTFTVAGGTDGEECVLTLYLRQDATGGRAWAFPATIAWAGGVVPTFSTAANTRDVVQLVTLDGGATVFGTLVGSGYLVPTAPAQVTGLSVAPGSTQNVLTWTAPANNGAAITNYKIYRSTTSGAETLLTTVGNVLTTTDTGLTNGTTYYYKVSAVNGVGEGTQSAEGSGTPAANHYLTGLGASGAYLSSPSASSWQPAADLRIDALVNLPSLAPTRNITFLSKWTGASSATAAYLFWLDTAGKLNIAVYATGFTQCTSSVALSTGTGMAINTDIWVRVAYATGGHVAQFFYSTDSSGSPASWTQLGSNVSGGTGAVSGGGTTEVEIAAQSGGTADYGVSGDIFKKVVWATNASTGGAYSTITTVDFTTASSGASTVTGSNGETWTLHGTAAIN